jgi:hypothetical protein
MSILSWWCDQFSAGPPGKPLNRFRKILWAAREIPIYEQRLRAAHLDTTRGIRGLPSIETALAQLGAFPLEQVRVRPPRNLSEPLKFSSPLPLAARPDALWDSVGCAIRELDSREKSSFRALFVRTGLDEGLLTPLDRDALWQRYGLPMFEHLIGMDGELLAFECETHDGLHIVEDNVVFQVDGGELLLTSLTDVIQPTIQTRLGWTARVQTEPCDCGRAGKRLVGLRQVLSSLEAPSVLRHAAHA